MPILLPIISVGVLQNPISFYRVDATNFRGNGVTRGE